MNSTIAMHKIAALNLDQIKLKLMHADSGEGWTAARADAIEVEYRRFLCLMHLYPKENFAPLIDVDIFWHYHILDTRKYATDCQQAFGYFLHHHPYVGLGQDDAADHQAYGERMHALYQATFGEACLAGADAAGNSAWCSLRNGATTVQAAQTAWCSLTESAKAARQTAWCSLTEGAKAAQQTAWCSLTEGAKAAQQTAWCSLTESAKAVQQTAWCSLTDGAKAARQTAWCSQSAAAKAQGTAWCSRVDGGIAAQSAWCSGEATVQANVQANVHEKVQATQTAWCSRVDTAVTSASAWCSARAA